MCFIKQYNCVIYNFLQFYCIDPLAMANSVRWYGHVLSREGGHVVKRELDFEVEGEREIEEDMEEAG